MVRGRPVEEHVQRRAEQAPPLRVVPPQRPRLKPLASTRSAPRRVRSLAWGMGPPRRAWSCQPGA